LPLLVFPCILTLPSLSELKYQRGTDPLILEKLDTIHWHELSHAYGAADDVPQLLRDIASPKEKKRARAYRKLYSTLYHQGTVYQASAYAVPFLIELLKDEHVPARHDILALLVDLASSQKQSIGLREPTKLYEKG
jgi:hypothetical protein